MDIKPSPAPPFEAENAFSAESIADTGRPNKNGQFTISRNPASGKIRMWPIPPVRK